MSEYVRRRYRIRGIVQGVGFRWNARRLARIYGMTGWVRNECDGSVTMELQTRRAADFPELMRALRRDSYIRIEDFDVESIPPDAEERSFRVR